MPAHGATVVNSTFAVVDGRARACSKVNSCAELATPSYQQGLPMLRRADAIISRPRLRDSNRGDRYDERCFDRRTGRAIRRTIAVVGHQMRQQDREMPPLDSRESPHERRQSGPVQTQRLDKTAANAPRTDGYQSLDDRASVGDFQPIHSDSSKHSENLMKLTDHTVDLVTEKGGLETPKRDAKNLGSKDQGTNSAVQAALNLPGLLDYEIIEEIARGGMGVVYRARQRSLNRIVAVKMILAGQLSGDRDVQRFRSEAEAVANLNHPNIVSIYEVGETGGQHFFSMQFVDGYSLAEMLRFGPLSAKDAAECVRTIAEAVEYAHGKGILHRDLKPSNVLLDTARVPHLTDFGVAKRLQCDSQMTATGAIIGTPSYMPPEQASGNSDIGRTADVYSLGAVLYELLTGRPPFNAEKPTEVLLQVLNSEPISPRILNPTIPADLSTICLKCLEKPSARRYPTARALASDLGRWLQGQPIDARPVGRIERIWRWCKRSPVVAGLAALLVFVILGAFVGVTSQWLVAQSALARMQEAQTQRAKAQVESLLKAAPESLTSLLDQLQPQYDDIIPVASTMMRQPDLSDRDRLRLSLALLPGDPNQLGYLRDRMLAIELPELLALREAVAPYHAQLSGDLWRVLNNVDAKPAERFSAAIVLANHETDGSQHTAQWETHASFLTTHMLDSIGADPSSYERLVESLRPLRQVLLSSLTSAYSDRRQSQSTRAFATSILVKYASDQPATLARLLTNSDPWQFMIVRARLKSSMPDVMEVLLRQLEETAPSQAGDAEMESVSRRRAMAAVALLQFGMSEPVWPMFVHTADPRARSELIELICTLKTDPHTLIDRLDDESEVSARRAILLALGNYAKDAIQGKDQELLLNRCKQMYASEADSGIHSASEWVLQRFGESTILPEPRFPFAVPANPSVGWCVGPEQHTLALLDGRASAVIGSPSTEERRSVAEKLHPMLIGRRFALGTKEVTVGQFRRFVQAAELKMPPFTRKHSPDDSGPIIMVTWYRAAQYCRWLSEQAGMPEDQMCYPPIGEIREGMPPIEGYLNRTGFRLPTEAEWEFASRAGALTSRAYGSSEGLLPQYGWYQSNSNDRAWRCGSLKPNDFGLFDMHGNAWEWCGDRWTSYWERPRGRDVAETTAVDAASNRVLRGGSFDSAAKVLRSAFRDRFEKPQFASDEVGFRIGCTIPD